MKKVYVIKDEMGNYYSNKNNIDHFSTDVVDANFYYEETSALTTGKALLDEEYMLAFSIETLYTKNN